MSRKSSGGGGGVKRKRQQQLVEEVAPASLQVTVHAEPLMLRAVVKCHFDALVWMQLCNAQGVSVFSFVHLSPRLPRPFAGAPVYDMSLTICVGGGGRALWLPPLPRGGGFLSRYRHWMRFFGTPRPIRSG